MLVLIALAVILVAGMAAIAACRFNRNRKSAAGLDGDWWSEFEAEFRAYAARQAASHRRLES